jgi:hypothetical protein
MTAISETCIFVNLSAASGVQTGMKVIALGVCLAGFACAADPALTIYNQNFAVVRETIPLDLKSGNNTVTFDGATSQVEPSSVILRNPAAGGAPIRILEQNYRNDPISQEHLLRLNEGKTIDFSVRNQDGSTRIVHGKIIRSGSGAIPLNTNGQRYVQDPSTIAPAGMQPIIEVDGKLQFGLPGQPIFPALGADSILKPALDWILYSPGAAKMNAELSYISGGLSWISDYNIIAPDNGDTMDIVGWVTLTNNSGKQFDHAHIKLMAGDVNRIQPPRPGMGGVIGGLATFRSEPAEVTEKAFEDYHLYSLPEATTIHDRETKQVEFLRGSGIQSKRLYVYDGAKLPNTNPYMDTRQDQRYGTESNPHVWIMREFVNSLANHLGIPLPAGRVRFYRQDPDGGQVEFTGENQIEHTPKDETIRIYTGNAFDIAGERKQTRYQIDMRPGGFLDESFEIKLRNHKTEAATVRVVEHLYRWANWKITEESQAHRQTDSRTVEFEVPLQPNEEKTVTYTAHYTW